LRIVRVNLYWKRTLSRTLLTKIHLWLAALLFPAIVMFLVTGGLYTWGITGKTEDVSKQVAIAQPLDPDNEAAMRNIAAAALAAAGVDEPTGKARVRKTGQGFGYEWTGARRDVTVETTADPLIAKVTIKEASLHRIMVQLHKAKAGTAFKVYASILAVALFLLVATGLLIGLKNDSLRRSTLWGSVAGLAIFAGLVATA
jgi:hypothetical protein